MVGGRAKTRRMRSSFRSLHRRRCSAAWHFRAPSGHPRDPESTTVASWPSTPKIKRAWGGDAHATTHAAALSLSSALVDVCQPGVVWHLPGICVILTSYVQEQLVFTTLVLPSKCFPTGTRSRIFPPNRIKPTSIQLKRLNFIHLFSHQELIRVTASISKLGKKLRPVLFLSRVSLGLFSLDAALTCGPGIPSPVTYQYQVPVGFTSSEKRSFLPPLAVYLWFFFFSWDNALLVQQCRSPRRSIDRGHPRMLLAVVLEVPPWWDFECSPQNEKGWTAESAYRRG